MPLRLPTCWTLALAVTGGLLAACCTKPAPDPGRSGTSASPMKARAAARPTATTQQGFRVRLRRDNDTLAVKRTADRVVFEIRSPYGISSARIQPTKADWPRHVTLHLHLRGLESFGASAGGTDNLRAGVRSGSGLGHAQLCSTDNRCRPVPPTGRVAAVRMVGGKTLPLKNGYFAIDLPAELFRGPRAALTVRWIDFYRR